LFAACNRADGLPATKHSSPPPVLQPPPDTAVTTLQFGAFSTAREALGNRILRQFERQRQRTGQPVRVDAAFAGSEELTQAILDGQVVDLAALATAHDLQQLVDAGLVRATWTEAPHGGVFCRSLVVIAVRAGNPLGIRDWVDLARPDVRIVSADPRTSGCGVWTLCALYGAALRGHVGAAVGDDAAARAFVARVRQNIAVELANAGAAYRAFLDGQGDAAITYESEASLAALFGHDATVVVPPSTILVENVAAVVDRHADARGTRQAAADLLAYLWSRDAQQRLAHCGIRPVDPEVAAAHAGRFPQPADLWTIDFLGGWTGAERLVHELMREPRRGPAASPGR
jgi:sulfate transport system substrate-binding protein